jgi:hypothetical protein
MHVSVLADANGRVLAPSSKPGAYDDHVLSHDMVARWSSASLEAAAATENSWAEWRHKSARIGHNGLLATACDAARRADAGQGRAAHP